MSFHWPSGTEAPGPSCTPATTPIQTASGRHPARATACHRAPAAGRLVFSILAPQGSRVSFGAGRDLCEIVQAGRPEIEKTIGRLRRMRFVAFAIEVSLVIGTTAVK
jgi:hypothetical protein